MQSILFWCCHLPVAVVDLPDGRMPRLSTASRTGSFSGPWLLMKGHETGFQCFLCSVILAPLFALSECCYLSLRRSGTTYTFLLQTEECDEQHLNEHLTGSLGEGTSRFSEDQDSERLWHHCINGRTRACESLVSYFTKLPVKQEVLKLQPLYN